MAYGSAVPDVVDGRDARKARGAFFTPPELADAICDFAISSKADRVLEPSCGEAIFLLSAARRLIKLGASVEDVHAGLRGNELDARSARQAASKLRGAGFDVVITTGDFFDMEPPEPGMGFSAVIGNPPYIRYQDFAGRERAKALGCALAAGVRLDALTSSWAPFVIHAARFLEPGGRLGFVLPAELLIARYAAPVRRFFLESFASVSITLFEKPVFPEVQEEVVLLFASGYGQGSTSSISVTQVNSARELGSIEPFSVGVREGERWPIGRGAREAGGILSGWEDAGFVRLCDYGDIHLGAVTGANGYFTLTRARAEKLGLADDDVVRICPPGSRHLRALSLGEAEYRQLAAANKQTLLFSPRGMPSAAAARYIELGQREGVSDAYKCRVRNPWWRVPGLRACDLFFTYMNGFGPNLCSNDAGLCFLNSVHGVFLREGMPKDEVRRLLPLAALSSATLLSAELVGRSYGGGILKLEPKEAGRMLVPRQEVLLGCADALEGARDAACRLLAAGRRDEATIAVDEALLPALGIGREEAQRAHDLLLELRQRRANKGASGRKKGE